MTPFRTPVIALEKDVPHLYECTVREHPIQKERPVATVIVVEDPMTYLERGDHVHVKGYFYKVRKYHGTKGIGLCPMLVARRIEPDTGRSGRVGEPVSPTWNEIALGLGAGLLMLMLVAFFFVKRLGRAKSDADHSRPIHRIRLRRPDWAEPAGADGPPGEGGGKEP